MIQDDWTSGKILLADAITDRGIEVTKDNTLQEFRDAIDSIPIRSGSATPDKVLAGETFSNDSGQELTGTIPSKGATEYTPGTTDKTIDAGVYLSGTQTIKGDSDLVSGNIKAGANIFGVAGNSNVVNTSDATATAAQILSGSTAYTKGSKVTGTMTNRTGVTTGWGGYETSSVQTHPSDNSQAIVSVANQYNNPGYYDSTSVVTTNVANLNPGTIKAGVRVGRTGGNDTNTILGTFTSDANATAAQILKDKTAYVNGAKVTGTITSKAAATYTPTTSDQTIAAGQYLSGVQTIAGDADLKAANIKTGVNIFNVAGTFTSDATAAANQILSGATAYVKGSKVTGTIASKAAQTYTPGTTNQTIAAGQYLSGAQTIAGSSNLVAGNIKSGVTIFNVSGNLSSGIYGTDWLVKDDSVAIQLKGTGVSYGAYDAFYGLVKGDTVTYTHSSPISAINIQGGALYDGTNNTDKNTARYLYIPNGLRVDTTDKVYESFGLSKDLYFHYYQYRVTLNISFSSDLKTFTMTVTGGDDQGFSWSFGNGNGNLFAIAYVYTM